MVRHLFVCHTKLILNKSVISKLSSLKIAFSEANLLLTRLIIRDV